MVLRHYAKGHTVESNRSGMHREVPARRGKRDDGHSTRLQVQNTNVLRLAVAPVVRIVHGPVAQVAPRARQLERMRQANAVRHEPFRTGETPDVETVEVRADG